MIVLRKKNELSVGPPSTNVQTTKAQFHSMCLLRYCHLTMDEKVQRSPMHPYFPHMLPPLFSTPSPMWHIHMMNQSTVWKSTLCIVYSWKNLVHEFGSIYRSVSAVMLLYCWFHSRLSMLWPLTDFFFHSVHGVEWSSSGRFVFYKPLSSLPAFIYFLLGETQRAEGGSGFY